MRRRPNTTQTKWSDDDGWLVRLQGAIIGKGAVDPAIPFAVSIEASLTPWHLVLLMYLSRASYIPGSRLAPLHDCMDNGVRAAESPSPSHPPASGASFYGARSGRNAE